MSYEVADLDDKDGVVGIAHIRIVVLTCAVCTRSRRTDNYDIAERFIALHNRRCNSKEKPAGEP
jgi:hypothetical protein